MPQPDEQWYIYHLYDGKIIMDRADHTDHMRQAYAGDPKFKGAFLAGTKTPLTPHELKGLEAQYEAKHDPGTRPALKPWVRPDQAPKRSPYSSKPVGGLREVK
jgi:hypothetical protein